MSYRAAIGYMIIAAQKIGLDELTIQRLETRMFIEINKHEEQEAEQLYRERIG